MTQPLYTVRQLAYVVRDMDAALKYWIEVLKVGPFFMLEHARLENQKFFGKPAETDVSIALYAGSALIASATAWRTLQTSSRLARST